MQKQTAFILTVGHFVFFPANKHVNRKQKRYLSCFYRNTYDTSTLSGSFGTL